MCNYSLHVKFDAEDSDNQYSYKEFRYKKIHDLLTWGHFRQNIKIKNISNDGNQLINLLKPDAILCLDIGCDIADKDWNFNPLLFGYKEIKIEEYRNNILFVAKNK